MRLFDGYNLLVYVTMHCKLTHCNELKFVLVCRDRLLSPVHIRLSLSVTVPEYMSKLTGY